MQWLVLGLAGLGSFLVALAATGGVLKVLRRRAILDHPNERSSHSVPIPRGGGIAVVGTIVAGWLFAVLAGGLAAEIGAIVTALGLALGLAILFWFDDLNGLPVTFRLLAQAVAVIAGLGTLPAGGSVFQGLLPAPIDLALAGLMWLWFINLFNFMDGIDGIAGAETAAIGLGTAAVLVLGNDPAHAVLALVLAAAALGFLIWNWQPARIFLGDVGSVALGFLIGWLLLRTAVLGYWAAALLLPLYYLADASITLLLRLRRGEKVWQAHRSHFYQQAAQRFDSHATVVLLLSVCNMGLGLLAAWTVLMPNATLPALIFGAGLVALLLWCFADKHGNSRS